MESLLSQMFTQGIFAFLLVFVRVGAAISVMPGLGDSFTPAKIRLHIAVAIAFVLAPVIYPYLPDVSDMGAELFFLIMMEFVIGMFFGMIARVYMMALDTAGMAISTMSGLGNAQLFNPAAATQGSLVGAILSVTGVLLLLASNLHHLLIMGVVGSYEMFEVGTLPDTEDMALMMARSIGDSFLIGIQIASPFIIIGMLVYIMMGVLSRLMPQIQVFLLVLPMQIMLAFLTLSMVLSIVFLFWLKTYEENMSYFLSSAGG